jgi:hypothetical protein
MILAVEDCPSYPLPTNGWNPSKRSKMALVSGVLHGTVLSPKTVRGMAGRSVSDDALADRHQDSVQSNTRNWP